MFVVARVQFYVRIALCRGRPLATCVCAEMPSEEPEKRHASIVL